MVRLWLLQVIDGLYEHGIRTVLCLTTITLLSLCPWARTHTLVVPPPLGLPLLPLSSQFINLPLNATELTNSPPELPLSLRPTR